MSALQLLFHKVSRQYRFRSPVSTARPSKRQGRAPASFLDVFSDPGAVSVQRSRQIFHQRGKKPLAGFICGSLKYSPERGLFIQRSEGGHSGVVVDHKNTSAAFEIVTPALAAWSSDQP
jgi:hypothetical protein